MAMTLGLLGGLVTVPYVALQPGPTFDTLGVVAGETVVDITGTQTYPTEGQLNMTTISVIDGFSLYAALGLWMSETSALVPREEVFPPDLSPEEVEERSRQSFQASETTAETAALRHLGYPSVAVVDQLLDDSAAADVLAPGDQLVAVAGRPVDTSQEVIEVLSTRGPGETVLVGFRHGEGPPQQAAITLGPGPEPGRGYLGIRVGDRPVVDFDITISLADVGGPSAGLMFALAIVDKLTPGSLAGDRFVAGTGEIQPDGSVEPIGGIPFKMYQARQAGATVFLVPEDNCDEALRRVPDGLRLVRVASLDEAVDALSAVRAGAPAPTCTL